MCEASSKPRWRFQFGIGALLALTVASAVGIAQGKRWYVGPQEIPPYSTERFEQARREGRVALVHLKADWNITDAVVRRQVLTESFRRTLQSRNVVMLQVDFTDDFGPLHPTIEDLVRPGRHDANPSCVGIYPRGPRDRDPIVLCPALDQGDILKAIDRASHWP